MNLKGVWTALVTPFHNQKIDLLSFAKLVEHQIKQGVQGLVVNGTTAESPNLTEEEVYALYRQVRQVAGDDFPILLGVGSNNHQRTVDATIKARDWGAQGALVVVPYYNKPTQEGLFQHYNRLAERVSDLPIVLYNVPTRTITSLEKDTIKKLSEKLNIIGVKEASGDIEFGKSLMDFRKDDWFVISGDDATFLDLTLRGGSGVISVISNIAPKVIVELTNKALDKDNSALKDYEPYKNLLELLYCEPNPIPVKMALYQMGIIESSEMRLPLTTMTAVPAKKLKVALKEVGLI